MAADGSGCKGSGCQWPVSCGFGRPFDVAACRLAYSANQHGWTAAAFHQQVDTFGAGVRWVQSFKDRTLLLFCVQRQAPADTRKCRLFLHKQREEHGLGDTTTGVSLSHMQGAVLLRALYMPEIDCLLRGGGGSG